MDTLTPTQRSQRMARVRGKNTSPEMAVRRLTHSLGYRFRLHRKDLPGRPDLVFPRHRAVILVHGCFWHRHPDPACPLARLPKSRLSFWLPKLERNRARDCENREALARDGWRVLELWECELKDRTETAERVRSFLSGEDRNCAQSNYSPAPAA